MCKNKVKMRLKTFYCCLISIMESQVMHCIYLYPFIHLIICLHSLHKVKHDLSGCWTQPGCPLSLIRFVTWTGSQGAARMRGVSGLGTSELHLSFLQMMWFVGFISLWLPAHTRAVCSWVWSSRDERQHLQVWVHGSLKEKHWIAPSGFTVRGVFWGLVHE